MDPLDGAVHRLLQQLPPHGSFLGIGVGILLGRRGGSSPLPFFPILFAVLVVLVGSLELNVQVRSRDELFFGLAESRAADLNFLVLPLVVGLVAALMAALATPLGPLLKSRPPLEADPSSPGPACRADCILRSPWPTATAHPLPARGTPVSFAAQSFPDRVLPLRDATGWHWWAWQR